MTGSQPPFGRVAAMIGAGAIELAALEQIVETLLGETDRRRFFDRVREFDEQR